jgi:hypothetical protein
VQNVRKFGTDDQMAAVSEVVNDKLEMMRASHEATEEWLRIGAIKGTIVDGDGTTTLFNLFSEFGISQNTLSFALTTDTTDVGGKCLWLKRTIEDALGMNTYDHVHVLCGDAWFDAFVKHPTVQWAYQYFQDNAAAREDKRAGFEYKGVIFENYRGKIGSVPFIPTNNAYAFPMGTTQVFITAYAPADFMETVNTIGLPVYAKQEPMEFNRGVKLHTQSNPLPLCTRPGVLVQLSIT